MSLRRGRHQRQERAQRQNGRELSQVLNTRNCQVSRVNSQDRRCLDSSVLRVES
jgi:hypothetical protein